MAPYNKIRVQLQDIQGQPRDSTQASAEAWARLQLVQNYTLLNMTDRSPEAWEQMMQATAPAPLPLEEHWNKFFYLTINLYREWQHYALVSLCILLFAGLAIWRTAGGKARLRLLLAFLAAQLCMMLLVGAVGYGLKVEYRVHDWLLAAQLLVPFIWLAYRLPPTWRPPIWVALCLAMALQSHHQPTRDLLQLQTAAFAPLAQLQPHPGEQYLFFTMKLPLASIYDETALQNPNTSQIMLPLGYMSITSAQQQVLSAALDGPYRVETLAQPHIHIVSEPATVAQLMAYLQATAPGRYALQTHRSIGRYQHCQIVRAQP
jgi:hypothetical protein